MQSRQNLDHDFHNNDDKNTKNGNLYGRRVFPVKVLIKFYVLHKIWNRIRIKYVILNSLIVQYDVWQPYVFRRYMQSLHTTVVIWVPLQFVVVPFLRQNKSIYSSIQKRLFYGMWYQKVSCEPSFNFQTRFIFIASFSYKINSVLTIRMTHALHVHKVHLSFKRLHSSSEDVYLVKLESRNGFF